jgi:hypothetical protein
MPIYETGHARNVQHFEEMVAAATSWGAAYDPTNASILLAALSAKLTASGTAMDDVMASRAASATVSNDRENLFDPISKRITRCVAYYESTGPAENMVDDVRSLKRKLDGARAKPLPSDDGPPPPDGGPPAPTPISVSQQSYTQRVEHLDGIIELLSSDANYNPNETELTVASLQTTSTAMKAANTAVINAGVSLSGNLGSRDDVMYADSTGLVDLALLVKKYTRAAFGADSTEFSQISGLAFRRPTEA